MDKFNICIVRVQRTEQYFVISNEQSEAIKLVKENRNKYPCIVDEETLSAAMATISTEL